VALVLIHDEDLVRAVELLLEREDLNGAFILAAPDPVQQREFMRTLRGAWGGRPGLPATRLMAEVGAFVLRTDQPGRSGTEIATPSREPGRTPARGRSLSACQDRYSSMTRTAASAGGPLVWRHGCGSAQVCAPCRT
jgi:nucleoside-diphosphate-sugar epimerase